MGGGGGGGNDNVSPVDPQHQQQQHHQVAAAAAAAAAMYQMQADQQVGGGGGGGIGAGGGGGQQEYPWMKEKKTTRKNNHQGKFREQIIFILYNILRVNKQPHIYRIPIGNFENTQLSVLNNIKFFTKKKLCLFYKINIWNNNIILLLIYLINTLCERHEISEVI